ncbi:MAG: glutamate 5-kinase [Pseudanabaenaceae cyanobacterium]
MSSTLVIKIGTSSLTKPHTGELHLSAIAKLVETIVHLKKQNHAIILVSSGAVGVGCTRLGMTARPQQLALKQAIAAVGQSRLMRIYDDLFANFNQPVAQILLNRQNFINRQQYNNIKATFRELLNLGVVAIVNENDTVSTDELKFGDNDTLSALVASSLQSDYLFILTDVEYLYSDDPRRNPSAQPISQLTFQELQLLEQKMNQQQLEAKGGSQWGTGGMLTKLTAAKIAAVAGVKTVILKGEQPDRILEILAGKPCGTHFLPATQTVTARKHWIAYAMVPLGKVYLDRGAEIAIVQHGKSLLPAGITKVDGKFEAGDVISLVNQEGKELARGISNYADHEVIKLLGCHSTEIPERLGYMGTETIVHRDDLVLV